MDPVPAIVPEKKGSTLYSGPERNRAQILPWVLENNVCSY